MQKKSCSSKKIFMQEINGAPMSSLANALSKEFTFFSKRFYDSLLFEKDT